MSIRKILFAGAVLFAIVGVSFAADVSVGTWKLNETKSKVVPGSPKNSMVVIAAAGDSMKVTVDGVGADGKPAHNEWTGKFDGKDYPITGDPGADMRSYKPVNDHTMELTEKKNGKTITAGKVVISADGKSRTVAVNGTDDSGKKVSITFVYDKQ